MAAPDPDQPDRPPPPLMGLSFWLALGFCLVCVLSAILLVRLGPVLFPSRPAAAPAQPVARSHAAPAGFKS